MVKRLPTIQETRFQSLGWEDSLQKEMATHSSILTWRIPWIEGPGGLLSMGPQRAGHDWVYFMATRTSMRKTGWTVWFFSGDSLHIAVRLGGWILEAEVVGWWWSMMMVEYTVSLKLMCSFHTISKNLHQSGHSLLVISLDKWLQLLVN